MSQGLPVKLQGRFSLALFKDSILRIKQLGLVDLEKDPDIKPSAADPTQFDVTVNVKELQRNNIQFTAGYSGYEGTFGPTMGALYGVAIEQGLLTPPDPEWWPAGG